MSRRGVSVLPCSLGDLGITRRVLSLSSHVNSCHNEARLRAILWENPIDQRGAESPAESPDCVINVQKVQKRQLFPGWDIPASQKNPLWWWVSCGKWQKGENVAESEESAEKSRNNGKTLRERVLTF